MSPLPIGTRRKMIVWFVAATPFYVWLFWNLANNEHFSIYLGGAVFWAYLIVAYFVVNRILRWMYKRWPYQ